MKKEEKETYDRTIICSFSNKNVSIIKYSIWECRNIGMLKILKKIQKILIDKKILNHKWKIFIYCGDKPPKHSFADNNDIELFCTTTDINDKDVFPDYVFGNWWHIGLTDFDKFSKKISSESSIKNILHNKIFWIGNPQKIPQRHLYIKMLKEFPSILDGDKMTWKNHSKPSKFIEIKDHCKWKYLIDLEGSGWSGRLKLLPFCKRPLLITKRKYYAWSDIQILKTNEYISVNNNLDNLIDKYLWLENNQERAFKMSINLYHFCKKKFTFDNICLVGSKIIEKKIQDKLFGF